MTSLLYNRSSPLILASRSPRRHDLLRLMQVAFEVRPADVDETHAPALGAREGAMEVAERKARTIASGLSAGIVLGADTVVVLDDEILGKPRDVGDARGMLARLTGRSHTVITGLALIDAGRERVVRGSESTRVTMRAATSGEIARYVAGGEPMDKAGSYGAQGVGAVFIDRVEGCFYNVVGLPIVRLYRMLRELDGQEATPGSGARID